MLLEFFSKSKSKEFWFLSSFWATDQDVPPFITVKTCHLRPTILSKIDRVCVVYMQMGRSKWIGPKDYPCTNWWMNDHASTTLSYSQSHFWPSCSPTMTRGRWGSFLCPRDFFARSFAHPCATWDRSSNGRRSLCSSTFSSPVFASRQRRRWFLIPT